MQESIRLPKMELSMEEGRIQKWLVSEGTYVKKGEIIAEIETDKAMVELEMPKDGTIHRFLAQEDELVAVGAPIAELQEAAALAVVEPREAVKVSSPAAMVVEPVTAAVPRDIRRIAISPAARRRARELGVDYTMLVGTGPHGRIVYQDLERAAALAAVATATATKAGQVTQVAEVNSVELKGKPLSKMRRTIARRMTESVNTIPQFSIKKTVVVTKPLEIKQVIQASLAKSGVKLSFTDFLISATAQALSKHRAINASFIGNAMEENCSIIEHDAINIGLAVTTDAGLVVPVFRHADELGVVGIAKMRTAKLESVRNQSLKSDDLQGGTFTISNLGMFEVDEFQAIVNPPEAGILAVGSIRQAPIVINGQVEVHAVMTLTGTFDHRVVDGAGAAAFMRTLAELLQSDEWILL
ncbi:hypothetical protein A8709_15265 [Paenibacillus pectinilyticus]|uniref:Dihydrolipoamide acetyltransferase component of pyruvate dehydrogenase complex n=1 Tax=Paenibacillus pectinilyticus TaxID=512399 RepID=A0A1C1A4F7_9BACL|nr:dihydrolipoamide acetyltransferase family protein [Paenibacillus pectinilyticus]OCT15435.1 hypothetical protein A8709_15265 [Paenibacillus pectinilyticus]